MGLAGAVDQVLAAFRAAGARAVDDLRDVNPPCVYVIPPDGLLRFDRRRANVEWVAYLVVANTGARAAVDALSNLLDVVAGLTPATEFRRDALQLPDGGDPLPAYRITWAATITLADPAPQPT